MLTALTAGYWAGMQVGFGDSDTEEEENVQRAPTGYTAGMQTEFGDTGTQDEEDVHRAPNRKLQDGNASTKRQQ